MRLIVVGFNSFVVIALISAGLACSSSESLTTRPLSGGNGTVLPTGQPTSSSTPVGSSGTIDQTVIPGPNPSPSSTTDSPVFDGMSVFNLTVMPVLNSAAQCAAAGCHANGNPGNLFDYAAQKSRVLSGASGADNPLVNKMRQTVAHTGGNRCPGGVAATPCKEVIDWATKEHANK